MSDNIKFKVENSEDSVLYHEAFIMCCKIFPGMMPYYYFRQYILTVCLQNDELIGFLLLRSTNEYKNIEKKIVQTENNNSSNNQSDNSEDSENDSLVSGSTELSNEENNIPFHDINIATIGIKPEMRGKGIGDKYVKWIIDKFLGLRLVLHVSVNNTNAIKLYEKNDFKILNTEKKYYVEQGYEPYTGTGRDAHLMMRM